MATTLLSLVVVVAVTCNIAIMYFPIDKKKRVTLCVIVSGILALCCLADNGERGAVPIMLKEHIAKNPYSKGPLMARFNITEEQLNNDLPKRTPIESGVCMALVMVLLVTPILLNVANSEEKEMKVLERVAFALNIVTVWALLSLFYGFELPTFVPWFKKTQEEGKPAPVLT